MPVIKRVIYSSAEDGENFVGIRLHLPQLCTTLIWDTIRILHLWAKIYFLMDLKNSLSMVLPVPFSPLISVSNEPSVCEADIWRMLRESHTPLLAAGLLALRKTLDLRHPSKNGSKGARTLDLPLVRRALSQLSYASMHSL